LKDTKAAAQQTQHGHTKTKRTTIVNDHPQWNSKVRSFLFQKGYLRGNTRNFASEREMRRENFPLEKAALSL
jgi:hypothetical protein